MAGPDDEDDVFDPEVVSGGDEAEEADDALPAADGDDEVELGSSLTPEQREQRRLARKPYIGHLDDAVATLEDGTRVPLFDAGDRIVVERYISFAAGHPWLDTRVYIVHHIDDETGVVKCFDEELRHHACVGFKSEHQVFKLAPKKGPIFRRARKAEDRPKPPPPADGEAKKRGRPKGSKNRPKDQIEADKRARQQERAARKERRR